MTVKFTMDRSLPEGTVLKFGVRFESTVPSGKVFTYAALKAGGLWYMTGSGQVPTAAGPSVIERWLGRDGRVLQWVERMGAPERVWPDWTDAEVVPEVRELTAEHPCSVCTCGSDGCLPGQHQR